MSQTGDRKTFYNTMGAGSRANKRRAGVFDVVELSATVDDSSIGNRSGTTSTGHSAPSAPLPAIPNQTPQPGLSNSTSNMNSNTPTNTTNNDGTNSRSRPRSTTLQKPGYSGSRSFIMTSPYANDGTSGRESLTKSASQPSSPDTTNGAANQNSVPQTTNKPPGRPPSITFSGGAPPTIAPAPDPSSSRSGYNPFKAGGRFFTDIGTKISTTAYGAAQTTPTTTTTDASNNSNNLNLSSNNNGNNSNNTNNNNTNNTNNTTSTSGAAPVTEEKQIREMKSEQEYQRMKQEANSTDLSDLLPLNIVYAAGHDNFGRPIIVIIASHIPPSKKLPGDRLLLLLIRVMDKVVESDYTLIYCNTQISSQNRPPFNWLKRAFGLFNRKYKKNLKSFFVIHPGFWLKTMFTCFKPFVSSKAWKKLHFIDSVTDLYNHMKPDQIKLPEHVLGYKQKNGVMAQPLFGLPLSTVCSGQNPHHVVNGIPIVCEDAMNLIEKQGLDVQGIFRISGSNAIVSDIKMTYDRGEEVDLTTVDDMHVVAGVLKLYLRDLPDPLFPQSTYNSLMDIFKNHSSGTEQQQAENEKENIEKLVAIFNTLPKENKTLLRRLFLFLKKVSDRREDNKMSASNLAIVFGPNLLKPPGGNETRLILDTGSISRFLALCIEKADVIIGQMHFDPDSNTNSKSSTSSTNYLNSSTNGLK